MKKTSAYNRSTPPLALRPAPGASRRCFALRTGLVSQLSLSQRVAFDPEAIGPACSAVPLLTWDWAEVSSASHSWEGWLGLAFGFKLWVLRDLFRLTSPLSMRAVWMDVSPVVLLRARWRCSGPAFSSHLSIPLRLRVLTTCAGGKKTKNQKWRQSPRGKIK